MVISVKDSGGTLRTVGRIRVMDHTGTLRTISRVRVMDSTGTLRTVYNNISVNISPDSVVLNGFGSTLVSGTVIVTASGGTTYAWSLVSSTGTGSLSFSNPTGSSTSLIATGLAEGEAFNGIVRCTVNSVQSIDIPFYFYRFSTTSPDPDDPNFHEP